MMIIMKVKVTSWRIMILFTSADGCNHPRSHARQEKFSQVRFHPARALPARRASPHADLCVIQWEEFLIWHQPGTISASLR